MKETAGEDFANDVVKIYDENLEKFELKVMQRNKERRLDDTARSRIDVNCFKVKSQFACVD